MKTETGKTAIRQHKNEITDAFINGMESGWDLAMEECGKSKKMGSEWLQLQCDKSEAYYDETFPTQQAAEQERWIAASDVSMLKPYKESPAYSVNVLVTYGEIDSDDTLMCEIAYYSFPGKRWSCNTQPTHWQPLPPAPKEA